MECIEVLRPIKTQNLRKSPAEGKGKMPGQIKRTEDEARTAGMFTFLRQRTIWWVLSLAVLLLLLGMIYLLAHLSSPDTEMYPTTQLGSSWAALALC